MNSATSTEAGNPAKAGSHESQGGNPANAGSHKSQALQPWQFFVLAALLCATVATFILRVNGIAGSVLLTALMAAAALVGAMGLRMVRPLFIADKDRPDQLSQRVRETLERDKLLALRTIKELEFDHAMGKLSEDDYREMSGTLRARATRLIRQLESSSSYRGRIERDVAARVSDASAPRPDRAAEEAGPSCPSCATRNDADARFCKNCGGKL